MTGNKEIQIESIYGAYRLNLKALRKAGPNRAGARKQLALKNTADRYRVPISLVKSIAREQDALAGITHEHDVNYQAELDLIKKADALIATHGNNPACPSCGNVPTEPGDTVRVRLDPFDLNVHGIKDVMLCCFMCYLKIEDQI
jgi:hypothetical protein